MFKMYQEWVFFFNLHCTLLNVCPSFHEETAHRMEVFLLPQQLFDVNINKFEDCVFLFFCERVAQLAGRSPE